MTFSTKVTKAQRNARDFDLRGRAISMASRHHTLKPGYNLPDGYVKPTGMPTEYHPRTVPAYYTPAPKQKHTPATQVSVRPGTKRGQRGQPAPKQHQRLDHVTIPQFLEAGCGFLVEGDRNLNIPMFLAIKAEAGGDVCTTGCGWFNNGQCPAYVKLVAKEKT